MRSAGLICIVGMFLGQVRAEGPEFEVATVKAASQPTPELFHRGKIHLGMAVDGGRVDIGACR
jgi:hypothetical protein